MTELFTSALLSILFSQVCKAQFFSQYFDGADTSVLNSIIIEPDTGGLNVWQIGSPRKVIFFYSAATTSNPIVTDTLNHDVVKGTSRLTFKMINQF